jgi:RNase P/RNase MRP subunit POP5
MVKFKSRYILLETIYEKERVRTTDAGKMANILRSQVELLFGDVGSGKISKNLQVKYLNNFTNLLIVRVGKEHLKLLWTMLALCNEIEGEKVKMHIIGVSGTIKKCETRAKKFLEKWMVNYEKSKSSI